MAVGSSPGGHSLLPIDSSVCCWSVGETRARGREGVWGREGGRRRRDEGQEERREWWEVRNLGFEKGREQERGKSEQRGEGGGRGRKTKEGGMVNCRLA